ncbi:glycosyl hydrolase [Paenibacillus sp. HWE-109]|uniref:sugar-binding protein n=1 Tax=Paenibacillus sp. HWE-109 TaxID=1306526 RepID=UPI001EE0792F|nr:sugar-binding protein [Paenibacillus sp. HWE-109]UKS27042.1 glycosyl hydrolase [Paenibacillus sp. HWE-109]
MLISLMFTSPLFGLQSLDNTTVYAADALQHTAIGNFESEEEVWNFGLGSEFPGAQGAYERDASAPRSGTFAGKLHGDFSAGGKYVAIGKKFLPLDMQKLEFWVKSADASALTLRVVDSTGQVHQRKIALANANWQKIEISTFNIGTNYLHFGGANDGKWHGPAGGISFLLEKSNLIGGKTSGDAWVDDVSVTAPPQENVWENAIGTFEKGFDIWTIASQGGAKGEYIRDTAEVKSGAYSGKLSGNFSASGLNVSLGRSFTTPMDMKKLAFWVKTADYAVVLLLMKDSTGQVHQQKIALAPTGDWQKIEVWTFNAGTSYLHYNGANDGVWHGPAQAIGLLVEKSGLVGGKTSGDIRFDNVVATSSFPDLSIEQSRMGNVFLANEPAAFPLATRGDTVSWSVYDHLDHPILAGSSGVQDGQLNLTIPIQQLGYYKLSLAAEKGGQTIKRTEISFARLAADDPTLANNSPFGVSTHLARTSAGWTPELSTLLKRAGSKNFRDEITWVDVEYEKGKYQKPPGRDAFMRKTQQDGLKPFITFDFTNPFYDQDSTPYSDEGRQGFANYGKALLDLYGNQMEWVEVYNEFNGGFGDRGNGPADSRPDYYFKLLKKTYETVKAARPDVTVVGMASNVDLKWMEEVFKLGGLQYMDTVSIHPYNRTPDGMLQDILAAKSLIRTYNQGQDKPLWITEVGWPTHIGATGVVEKTQADYLVRAYVQALSAGVEKIFWYDLMNDGMQADYGENNFGLIRHQDDPKGQFTPKPAYAAYGAMTRELLGATFVEQETVGTGITSYRFDKNGQKLRTVWANTPVQAAIQTNSPIQIMDIMGNTETFTPLNGKVYMTLTAEPIYIQSEINGITVDSTFAVTGDEAVTGEPVALTVEAKNSSASPLAASFTVEGSTYSLNAGVGQNTFQPFALQGLDQEGIRYVTGNLIVNGSLIGRLKHEVQTLPSYHARLIPVITDVATKAEALHIQIQNNSKQLGLAVRKADWKFGTLSGTQDLTAVIPPDTTKTFDIPLSGFTYGVSNQAQVTVQFDGKQPFVYGGKLDFNPILPGTVQIDGVADPAVIASPPVALLSQGTVKMQNYRGASDLDGSVWVNWDQDHFNLTAMIKDDVHYTTVSGAEIWKNDSLQFAAMAGIPGENLASYEFGLSQTPVGPQIYRWLSPNTSVRELVTNGSLQVSRNEDQKLTVYELALPWSELAPIKPETNGAFSFSLLVNDNDGAGRKGYIEWGSGIGETKDPKKFRTVQWIKPPTSPVITIAGVTAGESYTDQVIPVVKAEDEDGDLQTVRTLLDEENWISGTPVTTQGNHTLFVEAIDRAGNSVQQTVPFKLYRSTVLAASNAEGRLSDIVQLRATLQDKSGQPIAGETVSFTIYGNTIGTAVTDANGVAALSYTIQLEADADQEKVYPIQVAFNQNDAAYFLRGEGSGTITVKPSPKPDAAAAPGKAVLSDDNGYDTGIRDGNYSVTMQMWWGNNGSTYKLYENDLLIDTQVLTAHSPNAQTTVTSVTYRNNGIYRYYAELINAAGTTRSDVHTVTVSHAAPAVPVLSHDNWDGDGSFNISMNMWWGTNGTMYRLYENGVLIDTQPITDRSPSAQSATTVIRGKPKGTYEYQAELVNYAGAAVSGKMIVKVDN